MRPLGQLRWEVSKSACHCQIGKRFENRVSTRRHPTQHLFSRTGLGPRPRSSKFGQLVTLIRFRITISITNTVSCTRVILNYPVPWGHHLGRSGALIQSQPETGGRSAARTRVPGYTCTPGTRVRYHCTQAPPLPGYPGTPGKLLLSSRSFRCPTLPMCDDCDNSTDATMRYHGHRPRPYPGTRVPGCPG
eukprot:852850-Rhodomonas_salina.1